MNDNNMNINRLNDNIRRYNSQLLFIGRECSRTSKPTIPILKEIAENLGLTKYKSKNKCALHLLIKTTLESKIRTQQEILVILEMNMSENLSNTDIIRNFQNYQRDLRHERRNISSQTYHINSLEYIRNQLSIYTQAIQTLQDTTTLRRSQRIIERNLRDIPTTNIRRPYRRVQNPRQSQLEITVMKTNIPKHISNEIFQSRQDKNEAIICSVCLDNVSKASFQLSHCGHNYCEDCLNMLKNHSKKECAVCRTQL